MEKSNGVTKTELDYILTNRPDIVTDVTVINQVNIGSDDIMVLSNIKLDVEVEKDKMMTKSRCHANRIKEDRILTRIENRFETLQELDDTNTISETITDTIQQSASIIARAVKVPLKSRISSPTQA